MPDYTRIDGRTLRFQHRRPELLEGAAEYLLDHGTAKLGLRPVANAVGVTHATLLRHFSTKDALLVAVVDKIRVDLERAVVSDPKFVAAKSLSELARAVWKRLCDPKEQRQFALLFDIVQERSRVDSDDNISRAVVDDWIKLIADSLRRFGHGDDCIAVATLLLAQFRGLQLDLLLTGDHGRVGAALDALLRVLDPAP